MHRITKKDCNTQLEFIKTQQLKDKVGLNIKQNGIWKNFYRGSNLIVTARTWSELYYQLVAFKQGVYLARLLKAE